MFNFYIFPILICIFIMAVAEIVFRLMSKEMEKRRIIREKELLELATSKSFKPRELSEEEIQKQELITQKLKKKKKTNLILLLAGCILSFVATIVSVLFLNIFSSESRFFFYAKEAYPMAIIIFISTIWHLSKTSPKKNYT